MVRHKHILLKTVFREIKGSMGRYLAILSIIALGIGVFTGLKACKPSMIETVSGYVTDHALFDFRLGNMADAEAVCDIVEHVIVREKCVTLKNGVDLTLVRRNTIHVFRVKKHFSRVRFEKSRDNAQRSGFAASGRAEKCDKFTIADGEIEVIEDLIPVKSHGNVF